MIARERTSWRCGVGQTVMRLTGVLLAGLSVACGARTDAVPCCVDLIAALPQAEIRPVNRPADAVRTGEVAVAGETRRGLSLAVPVRLTFPVRIPPRAVLTSALAVRVTGPAPPDAGVVFRVGISDGRVHELLFDRTILARDAAGWEPLRLDLRRYAGWQWSLFYHPSRLAWQVVLYAFPAGAGTERLRAVWASPAIAQAG